MHHVSVLIASVFFCLKAWFDGVIVIIEILICLSKINADCSFRKKVQMSEVEIVSIYNNDQFFSSDTLAAYIYDVIFFYKKIVSSRKYRVQNWSLLIVWSVYMHETLHENVTKKYTLELFNIKAHYVLSTFISLPMSVFFKQTIRK